MHAELVDVTSASTVLSIFGPKARDILAELTRDDVSNETFPFGTWKRIGIAGCTVTALRITYVGELGFELHLPVEYAVSVYEALHHTGAKHGLCNAGYRAIDTLRLEKGYRAWGADIGPDHTPIEAGLGWAVKLKTDTDFRGRRAIQVQSDNGVKKRLATFTTDPDVILHGRETIYRNGESVLAGCRQAGSDIGSANPSALAMFATVEALHGTTYCRANMNWKSRPSASLQKYRWTRSMIQS